MNARYSLLSDDDLHLFNEGRHRRLYRKLGAHAGVSGGKAGAFFGVWAPDAERVSVVGDFNRWDEYRHTLHTRASSGIWEGFVSGVEKGMNYKFRIASRLGGYRVSKADPFAVLAETPPKTASVVWDLAYDWGDSVWMAGRGRANAREAPISIYEVHLGSWRRIPEEGGRSLSYREMAPLLAAYIKEAGFTHVEFLPVMEHPFFGSWGYLTTSYFAPSSRYGAPQDFMFLVDYLHQNGIGVILDWVPSHFPRDEHGLAFFDGSHLYEHADPRLGFHPDWNSAIFNFGRNEVRSFLLSNAMFWLDVYHADGLRVDAVASMLYRDYSRRRGEWIPNVHGGRENLEAIDFLRRLNEDVYGEYPDVQMFAEESTAWPLVSRPTSVGGLGFGFKWDMGWMHDTLAYLSKDPVHRKYHHDLMTFRFLYAFNENFVLPLSHDEAVHGKGSLLGKMPGDDWRKRANLRLLFGIQFAHPGKKLVFMGGEFGQGREWNHDGSLDWDLLGVPAHEGIRRWVADLNHLLRTEPALHERDSEADGFEWIDCRDVDHSIFAFLRWDAARTRPVLAVFNFTPVPRFGYRVGVPEGGSWVERLNGDSLHYGGSGLGNLGEVEADVRPFHGQKFSLALTLPPLAAVFFTPRPHAS